MVPTETNDDQEMQTVELTQAVLEAIGKRLNPEKPEGPPIQEDIALRVTEIIENGLPGEEQKDLLNKYATPKNCPKINAPALKDFR